MAEDRQETFGDRIRLARARERMTLRDLGGRAGTTASYLSDIENDRRIPSEPLVRRLAEILALDPDDLLAAAGRLGDETDRYLRRTPEAGILLRRMSAKNVGPSVIKRILQETPELEDQRGE
jgi:transcriptional regulator with XRE-family HTH domain